MLKNTQFKAASRILDANINRAKEGLRVCEEISRFILQSRPLTAELKRLRHGLSALARRLLSIKEQFARRSSLDDVGFSIYEQELKRRNWGDVFFANIQRAKESLRVLEEFSKLKNPRIAIGFKRLRYRLYEIEKKAVKKLLYL